MFSYRSDGELLPVMRLLDERLSTDEAEPPMRSATGWPVEVRASEPAGLHELTASGANADEQQADRLPPPKLHTITRRTQCSMALTIERYVCFVKRVQTKDGTTLEIPKRLPALFVNHYLNYDRSRLPRATALATMPLVLPDGRFLATNGLDRARRIVFRIEVVGEAAALMGEDAAMRVLARILRQADAVGRPLLHAFEDEVDAVRVAPRHPV